MIPCIAPPIFNGQSLWNFFLKIARNSQEIAGCQLSELQQNFPKHLHKTAMSQISFIFL